MKQTHFISTLVVVAQSLVIPAAYSAVELSLGAGTDNNAFRLADKFDPESGRFYKTTFSYSDRFDNGVYVNLKATQTSFESKLDYADSDRQNLKLGFRHTFDNSNRFNFAVSGSNYDKTYISRTTGKVGTSGGKEIEDRYDNRWWRLQSDYTFNLSDKHSLNLFAELLDKNYEEVEGSDSLSNLDYRQLGTGGRWFYKPAKGWRLETSFRYRDREYDDKRARDDQGKSIENSDLSYDYYRFLFSGMWSINRQHRLVLRAYREDLNDNYSGYYDRETTNVSLSWRYRWDKNNTLNTRLQYIDYRNANDLSQDEGELDEDENDSVDNHGTVFTIDYQRLLWKNKDYKVNGYVKTSWYNYDAPRDIYQYQRSIVELGVSVKF
ncbi:hypothetical protein SG34_019055 [Thalassomonas viridans]|uniref:Uncharacterized protein n=1 Tax=Thalassomonas viridans TaxID=137584 RepID=A0AAF0C7S6_9GAMM|nr:hypothetical protein [Thalassomonas viridans]WDE03480.1 hypothetical protein SG34_019055 [Thalassomonas viridans]